MWQLNRIRIKNIVSLKEVEFSPEENVATLIFGKNEDNSAQPCNGSGKSSLVEAISFALTGEQLRKVKSIEEIINDSADEAYVELVLVNYYNDTTFVIERTISRNAAQVVRCKKYHLEEEIEQDKMAQPTVADYNKLILSEIGLSKDEIYNNFILCDNKYESFFDASDRTKKEIINQFTNGVIVDESIEKLRADMVPVEEDLNEAKNEFIKISGKISAIQDELAHADEKEEENQQLIQERVKRIDGLILQARQEIESTQSSIKREEKLIDDLCSLQKKIKEIKSEEISVSEAYAKILAASKKRNINLAIADYESVSANLHRSINEKLQEIQDCKNKSLEIQNLMQSKKKDFEEAKSSLETEKEHLDRLVKDKEDEKKALIEESDSMLQTLENWENRLKEQGNAITSLETRIIRAKTLLEGAVECPECHARFVVEANKLASSIEKELQDLENQKLSAQKDNNNLKEKYNELDLKEIELENKIDSIEGQIKANKKQFASLEDVVLDLKKLFEEAQREWNNCKARLSVEEIELDGLYGKVDNLFSRMFESVEGKIESWINNHNSEVEAYESMIIRIKASIEQYQLSKKQLEETPSVDFKTSLKTSLERYEAELKKAEEIKKEIQSQYDILKEQELNFILFKSYLARKKIDALSLIVNDFLEKIGSDIRLKLEGYSVTKTGKLRDKISVQVMRDGIDCGSYQKFSGGEKARLNLACILALHTLTNNSCEPGKGLDFLIIDELLDKSDEVGMATYCDALNKLGQTALLITQGAVSEGYPYKLLITKRQGVSTISN